MNKKRPVNLNLLAFKWPVMALASGFHRFSGFFLFFFIPICLWALQLSLTAEGFVLLSGYLDCWFAKLLAWGILLAVGIHTVAGIRHMFMDAGYGETLKSSTITAYIIFALTAIIALVLGVWIW